VYKLNDNVKLLHKLLLLLLVDKESINWDLEVE